MENISNKDLSEESLKLIIRKFNKRKVHLFFIDNIWGADLANMQISVNLIKDLGFYYVLLIILVIKHELFL